MITGNVSEVADDTIGTDNQVHFPIMRVHWHVASDDLLTQR